MKNGRTVYPEVLPCKFNFFAYYVYANVGVRSIDVWIGSAPVGGP
ncbi:hypothetical protein [Paenibacillus alginolyticus]|nr:hypothetical protein [Paenibacillus alginolyticus]